METEMQSSCMLLAKESWLKPFPWRGLHVNSSTSMDLFMCIAFMMYWETSFEKVSVLSTLRKSLYWKNIIKERIWLYRNCMFPVYIFQSYHCIRGESHTKWTLIGQLVQMSQPNARSKISFSFNSYGRTNKIW